jgi:hypothetical protein
VGTAYIVELIFAVAGLVPQQRLAALLVWRFLKSGGRKMLRMMNHPARAESHQHFMRS